jgi:chorismate mutase
MELNNKILIAGPCAAESESQLRITADQINQLQIPISYFRAGIWKPRSHPNDFSGAGIEALDWLKKIKRDYNYKICVEVARGDQVQLCIDNQIDAIWIGARTTVNPFLVQEIADRVKDQPIDIFVKNPITPELKTWIGAIERIKAAGIHTIMAVHRGFSIDKEQVFRNNPMWEIPIILKSHFPDIPLLCDASHISGTIDYIPEISQIALDYGFDGLMLEVHHDPKHALSDASQQLTPEQFLHLIKSLNFKSSISTSTEMELLKHRNLIALIDTQISELLRKRMEIVDEIAKIKQSNNIALLQPEQWKSVVTKYLANALPDPEFQDFITNFLDLLHQASLKRQKK